MRTEQIHDSTIVLRRMQLDDIGLATEYFSSLSQETRMRFGPHGFDSASLHAVLSEGSSHIGYIALDASNARIIAYAIVRLGLLPHDIPRLQAYGWQPNPASDATYAPSVADEYQGMGLGTRLFHFIREDLQPMGIERIILWGGVQASNERALHYYRKLGFQTLGAFEYHGMNMDMVLDLRAKYM